MGGFIKGIGVGLASFVLGFAVLSVAVPVDPVAAPEGAPVATDLSAGAPPAPVTGATPDTATPDAPTPAPGAPLPDAPVLPVTTGTEGAATLASLPTAAPNSRAAPPPLPDEPAPGPVPDVAAVPAAGPRPMPAGPSLPGSGEVTAPAALGAPAPLDTRAGVSAPPAADAPGEPDAPLAALPGVATPPAPVAPAMPANGAEATAAMTAPAPAAAAPAPVPAPTAELPGNRTAPLAALPGVAAPPAPAGPPMPATGAETAAALPQIAPVAAGSTPASEPLLATAEPERPPVTTLPTSVPGVVVGRGGFGDALTVRRGAGEGAGRLPTIGAAEPAAQPAAAPAAVPGDDTRPAVERFAAAAQLGADQVPLGLVLTDDPAAETAILALPVPVTIAMNPYDPDAPRRARAYRAAGHEIALQALDLPGLATASDLATILDGWRRAFPEAMAVIDVPLNGLGANPVLARNFAAMLAPEGYGAISLRDGLDAFLQAARSEGMRAASIYRIIEGSDQSEFAIRRLIDRAAFEALRQPGVLIAASAAEGETMRELADFARGDGRAGVALAPASVVLNRD